ncbi:MULTISPECIES: Crp/Fnr family transcriptional regulator [Enterococcus]|uniref:CRP/FNR family transcriptional regulator, arginine deiminase pathway regulator n=1 Tax=Candidatus Enterococcus ferrettii TaxID=2815324 RepID=A0ABV0EUA6_9ENTE|nr:Crp/Fnr family transcriptional regulator [Enterococcus sp. 665A]MBO1339499.1 Crp/Fnr family transcriptional regulator [Enterococcus sp. 665A]
MEKNSVSTAIDNHPYFSALDQEVREMMERNMYYRFYKKGQVLFDTDDKRDRIFILDKGLIRIERVDQTACYNFLEFLNEKRPFPLLGMFEAQNYHFSAIAMTDIQVFYLSTAVFERIVKSNNDQLRLFNSNLNHLIEKQIRRIQYSVISKATERVENTLSILMEDLAEEQEGNYVIPYPIMINDISRYSGTTRETASQTIKALVKQKKIDYQYKELKFLDTDYFISRK